MAVKNFEGAAPSIRPATLWHPNSPGIRVEVQPSLLRRLRIIRDPFATRGEMRRYYRTTPTSTTARLVATEEGRDAHSA